MRRLPVFATIIAAAAVLTMIALGVWQLQRKGEKEALLARYADAPNMAAVAFPAVPDADNLPLFRKSSVQCSKVTGWRSVAGKNAGGTSGFAHLATCQTGGADGVPAIVAIGWTSRPEAPTWQGGTVNGVIAPHQPEAIRLVATDRIEGVELLAKPSLEAIPNNHLLYAIQWFFFATAAALIFLLAARKRQRDSGE